MLVLGVDPGLTRCGFGAISGQPGARAELVDVGVIRTPADLGHALRLLRIEQALDALVVRLRPDKVAVERVFAQQNLYSVTGTTQAAGIAMLVAARHGVPVTLHTPTEVKAAITGSGRADKAQLGAMVTRILGLAAAPRPADAADAVALALCQLWRGSTGNRYAAAVQAHRSAGRSA